MIADLVYHRRGRGALISISASFITLFVLKEYGDISLLYQKQIETETFGRHARMLLAGIQACRPYWMPDNYIRA